MTEPVRIAVVGWGNFFNHIHEQTVADLVADGRCELRAVCVRSDERRAGIMERLPATYGTADAAEVMADPAVDAVLIGAPQAVQARYSIDALAAGKYVYCEKPFFCEETDTGVDPAAFVTELAALGEVGLQRLAIGLNKRFAPAYRELRQRCREEWGGVRLLQWNVIDDAWRWGAKYPDGFLLWLDLCHWLDLARWFTGAEVRQLSCLEPQPNDAQVTVELTDGTVASILLSGNGTMDLMKEELRLITAGRRSARVTDYIEMEVYGGATPELRSFPANQQSGGDRSYTAAIDAEGLPAFTRIRREVFERFQRTREDDPAGDERVRRNIPNFMRPQGWRESVVEFVEAVAARQPLTNGATWRDAYIAYDLLDRTRASIAAGGQFVPVSLPAALA